MSYFHEKLLGAWISERVTRPMGGSWNSPNRKTGPCCCFHWSSTAELLIRWTNRVYNHKYRRLCDTKPLIIKYPYRPQPQFIVSDKFDCKLFQVSTQVKVIDIDIEINNDIDYSFSQKKTMWSLPDSHLFWKLDACLKKKLGWHNQIKHENHIPSYSMSISNYIL